MAEGTATQAVDAAKVQQTADAAGNNAQSLPAGGSRTFTEQELDQRIKARIDKQNAKHAAEMEGIRSELEQLRAEKAKSDGLVEELRKRADRDALVAKVTAATGIDAGALAGDTEEELMAAAERVRASVQQRGMVSNTGASASGNPRGPKDEFASFMAQNFNH